MIFYVIFIASFLLMGYFALQIRFEEDISKILPKDKKIEKLNQVFQNSKFRDKLIVMVSLKDTVTVNPDSLIIFTDELINNIKEKLATFTDAINGKIEDDITIKLLDNITNNLPFYINEKDYTAIDSLITPEKIKKTLEENFKTLISPTGIALKKIISKDPVGISFLALKKLRQLQYDENFELYDGYIVTKNQKHLLFFITPSYPAGNTGKNAIFLNRLDSIITHLTSHNFTNIAAAYFGTTAVSVGNALQLRNDAIITQSITIVFIIIFLGAFFQKKRAPLIIFIPVLFGVLFSLAVIYFVKGQISIIALATGSVILGIAINYSLHIFNHYRHTTNIQQVIGDLAKPLTIGSLTTIGGFFCLEFVKSEMLKDLGLFAAFGLIGASLSSLIFLPHLIFSKKRNQQPLEKKSIQNKKKGAYKPEENRYLIAAITIFTIVLGYWAKKVEFEKDLSKMNFMNDKLKQAEKELNTINEGELKSLYIITEGQTLDKALVNNETLLPKIEKLQSANVIKKYAGVSSFIISDSLQKIRIAKWNQYWDSAKRQQLITTLYKEGAALKFNTSAFDSFKQLLYKDFKVADTLATTYIRKNLLNDYINEKNTKTSIITLIKTSPENKKLIYVTFENEPNTTVVDKKYLTEKFVEIINDDFTSIAIMTSILVFTILLLMYGRIELTLISFIPMLISWIWVLGIMGMFGIKFNIINIIISALIFGLGDDYSLFIMDGLLQEYKTGRKNLSSFKSSIFLSAITTIAGLGVLIFMKHPALQSIALISIIGIISVVIMSQILIPFFFNLLIKNRTDKGLFPWTLTNFIKSSFAFSYFIGWSIILTAIAWIFSIFNVKEKGKIVFHTIISKICRRLMYIMINVKKKIINPKQEKFLSPAIIIANHQSSLDILPLIMLHPKLIMFTNNRIWHSPLFGKVIRMADYFPVEKMETDINIIAERIKLGYSVIIFPEGTRSEDGTIKRFHKGAFYLAEKLNVDILPIMIHGADYTLTKQDKLLKDGRVTIKFLPRIQPDNTKFGNSYSEKAKNVGRYFREEFNILKKEIEQPAYFKEKLIYNYLYKGPILEWYAKIKIRLEKNYQVFHELIPKQGKILDIGCGYGFMSYMLSFAAPEREITGLDYDKEKIETANNCFSKTNKINFIYANILDFKFETYNAIILSDMLHYLQPAEQKLIIEKCIQHISTDGIIIIRDGDKDIKEKHKKTKLTEFFSTRLLRFNKMTGKGLFFLSGQTIKKIATEKNMDCRYLKNSEVTSNTIFILKAATQVSYG